MVWVATVWNCIKNQIHTTTEPCQQNLGSPNDEFFLDVFVDDEVKVFLSVSGLLVLETEVEVWQHVETGGEEGDRLGNNAQLSLLGLGCEENNTPDSDQHKTSGGSKMWPYAQF